MFKGKKAEILKIMEANSSPIQLENESNFWCIAIIVIMESMLRYHIIFINR